MWQNRIKQIKQQLTAQQGYLSSILSLLYNDKGYYETRENEKLGDDFIELWKDVEEEQMKLYKDSFKNKDGSLLRNPDGTQYRYVDILERLREQLLQIKKPIENIRKQSTDKRKEDGSV